MDTTINAIELETATYYPETNTTNYYSHNYQKKVFKSEIGISPNDKVYLGCQPQYQLYVYKLWRPNYKYPYSVYGEWKIFYFGVDTINNNSDSTWIINWPEDTVKAKLIYYQFN